MSAANDVSGLEPLLSDRDLERLTGRARSSWQKDRSKGTGPTFVKIGRLVRYRRQDFEDWLERQVNKPLGSHG